MAKNMDEDEADIQCRGYRSRNRTKGWSLAINNGEEVTSTKESKQTRKLGSTWFQVNFPNVVFCTKQAMCAACLNRQA